MFDQAMVQALANARVKREALVNDLEAALIAESMITTCRKGCTACCYWPFATSVLEGAIAFERALNEHIWTMACRKAIRQAAKLTTGLAFDVWLYGRIPCPFLRDNVCTIYSARPLACRLALTVNDPFGCSNYGPINTLRSTEILMDFHTYEERLLRHAGLKLYTMPFSMAVLVAAQVYDENLEFEKLDMAILAEHQK